MPPGTKKSLILENKMATTGPKLVYEILIGRSDHIQYSGGPANPITSLKTQVNEVIAEGGYALGAPFLWGPEPLSWVQAVMKVSRSGGKRKTRRRA